MEIWTAASKTHINHPSEPGPWSGHKQTTTGELSLTIDGATFTLSFAFHDVQTASNRGSETLAVFELTGGVTAAADGSRLLRATHRVSERHEYHEPMEDMWTPPIDREHSVPAGALAKHEQLELRLRTAAADTLRLEATSSRGSLGDGALAVLKALVLRRST